MISFKSYITEAGQIQFDKPKLAKFKKMYHAALMNGVSSFTFENHEVLVTYAKYMIQHLEGKLK